MSQPKSLKHRRGLHYVATFEAAKGVLVLIVGLGLLELMNEDLQSLALQAFHHLGLRRNGEISQTVLDLLHKVTQGGIVLVSVAAFGYAAIRLIEAYGLWHGKGWAQWLGIASCGIYLPFEFYGLAKECTWLKIGITSFNIFLMGYLIYVRLIDVKEPSQKVSAPGDLQE